MKVLLINPSMNFKESYGKFSKLLEEPAPCIGLAYIAAMLEKNNIQVGVIDDFADKIGVDGIIKKIKEYNPDVVGISCLTPSAPSSFALAKEIKRNFSDILMVFGNCHASLFADEILKNNIADVVVRGEGEYAFLELVKRYEDKKSFSGLEGVSFKENGVIMHNKPAEPIKNLDELPFPAWHLFPYKKYGLLPPVTIRKPIVTMMCSRGCPYRCSFCSLGSMKNIYRKRSAKNIADEIEHDIEYYNVKQIGFVDAIFPLTKEQGIEICDEIISRGLNKKIVWTTETRVDRVDRELLEKMKEAGCRRILYGIESGVQKLLDTVQKNLTLEDIRRGVRYAREAGVQTVGFFMLGLPGETRELSLQTIEFAKSLGLDFAKFALTVPFPGSKIYNDLVKNKKIGFGGWERYSTFNPDPDKLVYTPEGMTAEELVKLQQKANFDFYMRPEMIVKHLIKIRTFKMSHFLYGAYALLRKR